jgi:HPt (histidine-containing phosphotransfer) domain-containing protein
MTVTTPATTPIYSKLGSDPELSELVELFVGELPDRLAALRANYDAGQFADLARLAHQMKGAAGSYGFASVTPAAERLEVAAGKREPEDLIREALDELVALCGRLRAGSGN